MVTLQYRRLDKLRLLRRFPSQASLQTFLASLGAANDQAKTGELNKIKEANRTIFWVGYGGKAESTGLSVIYFSVQKHPAISIEFSPYKLSQDDWAEANGVLTMLGLENISATFRLASVEIALDVALPIAELAFFAPGVKSADPTYLQSGTHYIGSRLGHRRFRIYDKTKHLREKKGIKLSSPRTRIEAVHQGLKLPLGELHTLENPFGRLIAIRKNELQRLRAQHPTDFEFGHFCQRVKAGLAGHDAYWEQEKAARGRIAKLLRPYAIDLNGKGDAWQNWIAEKQAGLMEMLTE